MKLSPLFFLLFLLAEQNFAQLWVDYIDKNETAKKTFVHVILCDTISETNKSYWHIFEKTWNYSKLDFVSYDRLDDYLKPGNYFFSIIREENTQRAVHSELWKAYNGYSFRLWKYSGKSSRSKKEDILNGRTSHINTLGGIYLFSTEKPAYYFVNKYDYSDEKLPTLKFYTNCNYDGISDRGKAFFNWGQGFLANYLKSYQWYLVNQKDLSSVHDMDIPEALKRLQKDTLYIPDFALEQYSISPSQEAPYLTGMQQNPTALFKEYRFPYKIITAEQLDHKLLYDHKPFCYLLYSVYWTDKLISVRSSETGEVIYSDWDTRRNSLVSNPNIKLDQEDIKRLAKKIKGN